ncbi:DUF6247 family protein [Actinokineospora bangkokensis]|uniref:Prevent-host-death family protein n=1 Tax=Actinokineospora bangkokensis TaxID=1193682 RepID=A0A1Q9LU87_9PSEU|nr:DUF6247 family protein [Actinokineospora bangkokensis]OLR95573.1 hypothetical protein BJP25_00320 [Actinokineospora bangkokensis]
MTTEVQWSELQRDPKSVAALADQGEVLVRRRDGAPLLLAREDRVRAAAAGSVAAARGLRTVLEHLPAEVLAEVLAEEFAWVRFLPPDDRADFAKDYATMFRACAEVGLWSPLNQVLLEWRDTAAIHADPELRAQLSRPVDDDFGAVPDPSGT